MNLHKLPAFAIVAAAMMFVAQSSASAQINPALQGYPGCGYFGGYTYDYSSYEVPYFSVHPPVYYSDQIVYRPYGASPYAAPPGIRPVEFDIPVEPAVIPNPHFNPGKKGKATDAAPKVQGKKTGATSGTQANVMILNPYFQASNEPSGLAHVLK